MAEMRQSAQERAALNAVWEATPQVRKFRADSLAFARANGHGFDVEGMNAMLAFAIEWNKANGPLPDSGIVTG